MQPPLGINPAPIPAATPPPQSPVKPDRRQFDNRRVKARFLDWLIWVALYLAARYYFAHSAVQPQTWHLLALLAINATYFFACEAIWGQTMGKRHYDLRVVSSDGGVPSLNAIATRNVVRIVEEPVIALLVLLGSRGRRQRVGDLMSGTAVVDVAGTPAPPPRGPMLLAYPVIWAIGIAVFATLTANDGAAPGPRSAPVAYAPTVQVAELTPEAEKFAEVINKSCRDGIHAQIVAVGEIAHAARVSGAPTTRVSAVADEALAYELHRIVRHVRGLAPPPVFRDAFDRWRTDASIQVQVLHQIGHAAENNDQAAASQIVNTYGTQLLELTSLGGQLGFDDCLPKSLPEEA
ncbi:hypothetical protein BH10ACT11_BH10ACT11_09660 [soil metagenome]